MKHAELASRNAAGGFWLAAADPGVVKNAVSGETSLGHVRRAALLSDGAARVVDPLRLYDWPGLLTALSVAGPDKLIREVRLAEEADPVGAQWPRNKIHDDATAALVEY